MVISRSADTALLFCYCIHKNTHTETQAEALQVICLTHTPDLDAFMLFIVS